MHVNVLYTFRSVSRAIPMVSGSSDPTKNALHMNTFKVRCSDHACSLLALRLQTDSGIAGVICRGRGIHFFCYYGGI